MRPQTRTGCCCCTCLRYRWCKEMDVLRSVESIAKGHDNFTTTHASVMTTLETGNSWSDQ